jgi:flavin prenyltransferase
MNDPSALIKKPPQRLVVGISGASGVRIAIRLLQYLRSTSIETHLVISEAAEQTILQETNLIVAQVLELADISYDRKNIGAQIASGSFPTDGMVIIPCSIKTLSAVANAYSNDLLTRAADVTLKEGRPLLLVVREAPLHKGHIRIMGLAADAGAIIFPPVPAFYTYPKSLDDLIDEIIGRVLYRMGIDNELFSQWTS